MTRTLNIDLDFFLDEIAHGRTVDAGRLNSEEYKPWNANDVMQFLEGNRNLSLKDPTPGYLVSDHDEVFFLWRELIKQGKLRVPFDLIHVDAHADLGLWDCSYEYICCDLLHWPLEERTAPSNIKKGIGKESIVVTISPLLWHVTG